MQNSKTYVSTRNSADRVSASEGIVAGLSKDGGLYVPEFIDDIHFDLDALKDLPYAALAEEILGAFLGDFTPQQVRDCVAQAYTTGAFDAPEPVGMSRAEDSAILELWHGPTAAFKDMALTILPHLMTTASKNIGEDKTIVILTATSGDTGKAALEGFKDVENTKIIVFYPKDGVSAVQEAQMVSTAGKNTAVVSVDGNFDDTQNGVKAIFSDRELGARLEDAGIALSSANSINIGRLLPQIVYYYYSYFRLAEAGRVNLGEPVHFVVPSGNFGDILAGYYAKKTGLPVGKLVCASNQNNVLTDFFRTGVYDKNRPFYKTISPSMDILISSNLERLLYDKTGRDGAKIQELMDELKETGRYCLDPALFEDFLAGWADEAAVQQTIRDVYEKDGLLIDPHTAVAETVRRDLADELDDAPVIVLSTANPYKFSDSVYTALYGSLPEGKNPFETQKILSEKTGTPIPAPLRELDKKARLHDTTCKKTEMAAAVETLLREDAADV